jgi:hypothetical protein
MLKKKGSYVFLIVLLLMVISCSAAAQDITRAPRLNFKGITGGDFIGQAGLLYPFRNTEDSLWYTDLRYRLSGDDIDEWNLGLGYRNKLENYDNRLAGAYLFKDRRNEHDHYWDMWTIGGEMLTDKWDFRFNGYISDDETIDAPQNDEIILENQKLYYKEGLISSMNGFDFEVGKRFVDRDGLLKNVGVYAKVFSFFENNADTMFGHQLKIDKQFGDLDKTTWKLGAKWRNDDVRGSETEAAFAVSIPFGRGKAALGAAGESSPAQMLEARMTEQPERDLNIIVVESDDPEPTEAKTLDGSSLGNVIYVSAEGTGDGSSKSKPTNINDLHTLAAEDDVIIFMGDDGIIDPAASEEYSNYALKNGQKLLSAAGELMLTSEKMDKQTAFSPDVKQAVLSNSDQEELNDILILADNTMVSGLEFNKGDNIISGSGISGEITITNNKFVEGNNAIRIENSSEDSIDNLKVEISNNIIESPLKHGIYIDSDNNNSEDNYKLSVKDNIIRSARDYGVYIESYTDLGSSEIVIQNNLVEDSYYYPIEVNVNSDGELSQLNIFNNTINNPTYKGYDGVEVYLNGSAKHQVDIENNSVENIDDYGIYLYNNTQGELTANLKNNKIENVRYSGIYLNSTNNYSNENQQTFNVKNNLIENVDDYGIRFYYRGYNNTNTNGKLTVNLENNKINNVRYSGIYLDSYNEYANEYEQIYNIKNNVIENIDDYGVRLYYRTDNNNTTNGKLTVNFEDNKLKNIGRSGIYLSSYSYYYNNYSYNINNTEQKYNIINNDFENIREDAVYVNAQRMGNIETNFVKNLMNNIGSDGFNIYNYGSQISGEISGNLIDSFDYAVILYADDYSYYYDNHPAIYEENFLISANEFNGSGTAAIYLNNSDSNYGSEINVEVNDNLKNEDINMLIEKIGDNINITGNQTP